MNTKVIGSVVRWALIIAGAVTTFMTDQSFMEAFDKLKDAIASGNNVAIIGAAVTVITLGWSIWDKVVTNRKEVAMKSQIKSLQVAVAMAKGEVEVTESHE